jgi:hypothetical protein
MSSQIAVGVLALIALTGIVQWLRRAFCSRHDRGYPGSARVSRGDSSRRGLREVHEDDHTWSVHLDLAGHSVEVPLPQSVASNTFELRQAVTELASEVLGVESTPATWMQDQFTTMRMVYKDLSGRRVLMHENTKISAVYASRTLEVSMSR